ncbi:hypothetical protein Cp1R7AA1_114 [Mesorhizobium phage Cp1R7A-A1]|nr:hypothetical protein Cp1R7AA1_114 [Mesorhizobium phage Cp1R7A-A1]
MGLALIDGFDDYASSAGGDGGSDSVWVGFGGAPVSTYITGLLGSGRALNLVGANNTGGRNRNFAPAVGDTAILSFRFKASQFGQFALFGFGGIFAKTTSGGQIQICRGGFDTNNNTVILFSSGNLAVNTPYFIEVKLTGKTSGGSLELFVDGNSWGTFSGQTQTFNGISSVQLGGGQSGQTWAYDDLYVLNDVADVRLGDMKVVTLLANADTADADWTPSTGTDGYAVIDDDQANTSDYLSASNAGDLSLFDFANLGFSPATVAGIAIETLGKKSDAGTTTIRNVVKSGSAVANGTTRSLGTAFGYQAQDIFATDPNTSAAWTGAAIDALKAGIERVA